MKKFFRNPDNKKIAGVCSGIATFFNVDVTIIRLVFVIAFICGTIGFWPYLIVWIISSEATTPEQKCQLRGLPTTAENLQKFSK